MTQTTQLKSKPGASVRLDRDAWTRAGFDILAEHGVDGVRIEPLAKQLGVTKGSFYWHFRDRADLLEAMLESWRRRATLAIIERVDLSGQSAKARLRTLLALAFAGPNAEKGTDVELAIRLWGRRDARARQVLAEVDSLRLSYFAQLLEAAGIAAGEARARAPLCYSYMRIASSLPSGDEGLDAVVRLLLTP